MSELKISPELLQISPEVQDALKTKNRLWRWNRPLFLTGCRSHKMPRPQLKLKKLFVNRALYLPLSPLLAA